MVVSKRHVDRISAAEYMPKLREDTPRMLKAYGSLGKLAQQLKIRKSDALDLLLLALVENQRKPLQRRRTARRK